MTSNSTTNSDPLLRRVLLGRYMAKRIVSASVEAVTYEALDQTTGAALRIVRPVRLPGAPALDASRLRGVSEALAKLKGLAGLVLPVAAGVLDAYPFLVLPALGRQQPAGAGGSPSPRDAAAEGQRPALPPWLKQLSETLDAVHGRGLCHGKLAPDAVVVLEDGRIALDGLPLAVMSRAIGEGAIPSSAASLSWGKYAAPEVAAGGMPSPAADQYALARMVAETLGHPATGAAQASVGGVASRPTLPEALARALAPNPRERFAGCGPLADALLAGRENPAASPASEMAGVPELDMAPVVGRDGDRTGRERVLPAAAPLELDASFVDRKDKTPARRALARDEEELLDITFTKVGEGLLTERGTISKTASFGASRASWRRMADEFRQLSGSRQWIARGLAGAAALVLAYVLLTVVWRTGVGVANWARSTWETTGSAIVPEVASLKKSGEQALGKAKELWAEWKPQDSVEVDPPGQDLKPPSRIGSLKVQGEPWPERPEDALLEEQLVEPVGLIDEVTAAKDAPLSADGSGLLRGMFSVADPGNPDLSVWVGGFAVKPKGRQFKSSDTPMLDGTIVHHIDAGTTFVAQYSLGMMKQFWLTKDDQGRRLTVSAKVDRITDVATLNGAAFVLDEGVPECLALVYEEGTLLGGQWCTRAPEDDSEAPPDRVAFEPPADIVPPDKLAALDSGFEKASQALEAAVQQLPAWHQKAGTALKRRIAQGFRDSKP